MERPNATSVYLAYMTADGFLFRLMATIYSAFLILRLGIDPFQLLLLGTVLEATYLIFEIPTGVVADSISRRLSVVIGLVGVGIAFVVLAAAGSFAVVVVSQFLYGVFATFTSGADVAWVTDEIGEAHARPLYLRSGQLWNAGALAGIVTSVALASIDLRLPIALSGIGLVVLGLAMAIAMREEGFSPDRGGGVGRSFVQTLKRGAHEVRAHHILLLILATAALHGASTEGFDRLADFHLLRDIGLPPLGNLDRIVWFGIMDGVALLLGIGLLGWLKGRAHLEGHAAVARILAGVDLILILGVVAFGLMGSFWPALIAFWIVGALRSVREPVFEAWLNQGLEPATRATLNSLGGQADAVGQAAGGPALGVVATRVSVPGALVVSGLLRAPALLLYLRAIRRGSVGTLAPDEVAADLTIEG
jgi:DHA3 family tetracycline resistance protein-like MFS transporter